MHRHAVPRDRPGAAQASHRDGHRERGSADKTLVEFKLASNGKLKRNLEKQVKIYERANETKKSIVAILHFSGSEHEKVLRVLKELGLTGREEIVLIDASKDNKPSASVA